MFDMFLKARNSRKGFTIIELVIVIAIIGILSAVLIPNFSGVIFNANTTAAAANLSTMNKIAKTAIGDNEVSMLKGYAATVQNFGYDSTKAAVATAVYSSEKHQFIPVADIEVEDEKYDLTNFYPVAASATQTAVEVFEALPFVEKVANPQALITGIIAKAISDDTNKYNAVYFVKGSIALYDDLNLGDAVVVFLDGASVELNGKTLGAKAVLFVDTTGNTTKFSANGGMINSMLGYAVTSVSNFYGADGKIALTAAPVMNDNNNVEFYQDAIVETTLGGAYVNVASASYHLYGGILLAGAGTFTIDGTSHFVVEDGAYLLTDNGDTVNHEFAAVTLVSGENVKLNVSNNSVVSLMFNDADAIINGHSAGSKAWNSVNPMTYEICASAVQNTLVLYAQAGADQATVMAICDKFSTSVNNTVTSLGSTATLSGSALSAITSINTNLGTSVYGAISSAAAGTATTAVANSAAGAIASLAGVTTKTGLVNLAANTSAASSNSANAAASTTDYSFYANFTEENGVKTYHITTAKQLYSLSWIVCKGLDDFYGTIVSIDADLDLKDYNPWQPIGNGTYGFRGTMKGNNHTISNMKIDTESLTTITSLIGQAWSGTSNRAVREGVNYGKQTGDKYAIGFIGVLENGGSVQDLTFSKCTVKFNYNWNCSAAIVCGAVVSTGEDYSYNHGGDHITGVDGNGYAVYGDGAASSQYNATGPKWITDTQGTITGAQNSTEIDYRAYKGWTTTIKNVTTTADCYVECSGRPGGIVGSAGGRYSAGTPNNDFGKAPYTGYRSAAGANDAQSIFCSFGELVVDGCVNNAQIVQNWQYGAYCDAGGIVAYFVNKGGSGFSWKVQNCTNNATVNGAIAGQIVGNTRTGVHVYGNNHENGSVVCEGKAVRGDGVKATVISGTFGV